MLVFSKIVKLFLIENRKGDKVIEKLFLRYIFKRFFRFKKFFNFFVKKKRSEIKIYLGIIVLSSVNYFKSFINYDIFLFSFLWVFYFVNKW